MAENLNAHHRDTLEKIFEHPPSRNVQWRQVVSLLEAVGEVEHRHNGKLKVTLGPETEVLPAPHSKDVDLGILVDLRRMLKQAGLAPDGHEVANERTRDHGDSRWGEPT